MKNLFLFFSAFIPMYVLLLLKIVIELLNNNLTLNVLNTIILITLSVLILCGIFGVVWNVKFSNYKTEQITIISKTNITDQHFFGYFSIFILFALTFEISKVCMFVISAVIMAFIGIVYITNSMYYINPFLNILGFKFYEITYKIVGDNVEHTTKIFFKGELDLNNKVYNVKIKNEHFSFVDYKSK